MTAKEILGKYRFWRDIRIPALEMELGIESAFPRRHSSFESEIRGSEIGDPTAQEVMRRRKLETDLQILKNYIQIIERIGDQMEQLDPFLKKVFDLLVSRGQYSWVEMVDKSGLGETGFKTRRGKVLKYVDEAFEGFLMEESA